MSLQTHIFDAISFDASSPCYSLAVCLLSVSTLTVATVGCGGSVHESQPPTAQRQSAEDTRIQEGALQVTAMLIADSLTAGTAGSYVSVMIDAIKGDGEPSTVKLTEESFERIGSIVDSKVRTARFDARRSAMNAVLADADEYVRRTTRPGLEDSADLVTDLNQSTNRSLEYFESTGLQGARAYQLMSAAKLAFLAERRQLDVMIGEPRTVIEHDTETLRQRAGDFVDHMDRLDDDFRAFVDASFSDVRLEKEQHERWTGKWGQPIRLSYKVTYCYTGPDGEECTRTEICEDARTADSEQETCSRVERELRDTSAIDRMRAVHEDRFYHDKRQDVLGSQFDDYRTRLWKISTGEAPIPYCGDNRCAPNVESPSTCGQECSG